MDEVTDLKRRQAEFRKNLHGQVANLIRSMGDVLHIEDNEIKQWQEDKRFSKMVTNYAPAMLVGALEQKFGEENIVKLNTFETTLSQICPQCFKQQKKKLSERVHKCECGCVMDRDVVSAFLAYCCDNETTLQASKVQKLYKEHYHLLETACDKRMSTEDQRGSGQSQNCGEVDGGEMQVVEKLVA